jgi:AcrR family transcriptional regulator
MVQTLKTAIRQQVIDAAEAAFAESGYLGATMADIAGRAGVSTGNLYRYFANKDELFYSILTDEFVESFLRLLRRRVKSLLEAEHLADLDADTQRDAQDLLGFWVTHRLKVVILLDRAAGSRYESFARQFVDELMRPSLVKLRREAPGQRVSPIARFIFQKVFENTVRMIVAILAAHESEREIRTAFAGFWSYQLAGLAALVEWTTS